jgi:hypothetical protein
MAKSKTIRVTPNVQRCLEELKAAVKSLPAGDLKKRAEGALDYLSRTFYFYFFQRVNNSFG